MGTRGNRGVVAAILVAAVVVAAAAVYLGLQLAARPDEARVVELIDQRLGASGAADGDAAFNLRVERGIQAFIDKQRQAEAERPNQLAAAVPPPGPDDHVYGDRQAPVSLIEYSDFECPFCKHFHITAKRLVDSSAGQVNWVYRHFPLESHNPGAQKQAEASECAAELGGNDAFWRFGNAIYARTRSGGQGFPLDRLAPLAVEVGLDRQAFERCLASGKFTELVHRQAAAGARAGVSGTPGNILYRHAGGRVLAIHGAQPYERVVEAVRALTAAGGSE